MKDKKIMIYIFVIVLFFAISIVIYNHFHINTLERDLLNEQSKIIMNYYDTVENSESDGNDRYILFALNYADNELDKYSLNSKEIKEIINNYFNISISEEDINNIGITELLLDNNIIQNYQDNKYEIDKKNINQQTIAKRSVVIYKQKTIKKRGKEYTISYEKYSIDNPHEVLNYFIEKNDTNTERINDYLSAKGKIKDIKESVTDDLLNSKFKKMDDVEVTFILDGTKFLIK